jgi:hypothetical protein
MQRCCCLLCRLPCTQTSANYQPKTADGKQWMNNFHAKLYNLTDEAIRGEKQLLLHTARFVLKPCSVQAMQCASLQQWRWQSCALTSILVLFFSDHVTGWLLAAVQAHGCGMLHTVLPPSHCSLPKEHALGRGDKRRQRLRP